MTIDNIEQNDIKLIYSETSAIAKAILAVENLKLVPNDIFIKISELREAIFKLRENPELDTISIYEKNLLSLRETIQIFLSQYNKYTSGFDQNEVRKIVAMLANQLDSIQKILPNIKNLKANFAPSKILTPPISVSPPPIPDERPAPIRVAVENHKLVLVAPQHRVGSIDFPSANRIREALKDNLQELINGLKYDSNADKRYIRKCSQLLDQISQPIETVSIEALGLNFQIVEKMTKLLSHEMGGSVLAEMEHVLTGIGVMLNQFQEWRDYLNELAKTQIDPSDGKSIIERTKIIIEAFEKPDAPVDETIAIRLREMIEPVITNIIDAESIAVPLVCSLSNIFSKLSHIAIDQLSNSGIQTGALTVVGASGILLTFAITTIKQFCPTLSEYQPLKFMVDVMSFITKFYSQIKDIMPKP